MKYFLVALLLGMGAAFLHSSAFAGPYDETRYCGLPKRDAHGDFVRDHKVIAAFKRLHPCPSTGSRRDEACPGWALNHSIPEACGGCDAVNNLEWMRIDLKSGPGGHDTYERKIYGGFVDGSKCGVPPLPAPKPR